MKQYISVIILAILISGCTGYRSDLNKANKKLNERVVENNSSAKKALEYSLTELLAAKNLLDTANLINNQYVISTNSFITAGLRFDKGVSGLEIGKGFLERNTRLVGEGSPESTQIVDKLVSSNKFDNLVGNIQNNSNIGAENKIITEKDKAIERLIEYGAKYEKERNDRILSYFKWGGGLLLVVASIVGILFIPGVLPLLVGAFPMLTSVFGVISKKTATSLVKGVGEVRYSLKERIKVINEMKETDPDFSEEKWTTSEVLELLDSELSKSMSDQDKKLIQKMRDKLNI